MNYAARLQALGEAISSPLLVTRLPNLQYLIGFTGSNGFLLVRPGGKSTFITDGRYGEMAEGLVAALPGCDLVVYTSGMWDVIRKATSGLGPVGLEADGVMWSFATDFARETGIEALPTPGGVERLRRRKDPTEIEALAAAADAGDAAFSTLRALAKPRTTERELGWKLVDVMRSRGAESATWEPIVAAGPGASIPHYRSGQKTLGKSLLLLDYGCVVDGYHSDMSRTVWLAGDPDAEMRRVYAAVLESQEAGIAAVAPGVACGAVDEACRAVLRGYGYEENFLHSTGHGVGLEIHEPPWVRKGNDDLLAEGDVITVEPGVYLPGKGGVRIEDMVVVAAAGSRVLTRSSKEFQIP